jgi:hypothetical protein
MKLQHSGSYSPNDTAAYSRRHEVAKEKGIKLIRQLKHWKGIKSDFLY